MIDPLTIGAGIGGTALASLLVYLRRRRKAPVAPPQALPSPLSTDVAAIPAEVIIAEAVHKAAVQHWLHEAGHEVAFDERQRHIAAVQRATRLLHEAKMLPPGDLRDRVKKALADTKGIAHG